MFCCSVAGCSYSLGTKLILRTHVLCSLRSLRNSKSLVLHPNIHFKLSSLSYPLEAGKRPETHKAADETHQPNKQISNSTNSNRNKDNVIRSCFASFEYFEGYSGRDPVIENLFAKSDAPALSKDAYENTYSFFVILASTSSKNHGNNLLHVLRQSGNVISASKNSFNVSKQYHSVWQGRHLHVFQILDFRKS